MADEKEQKEEGSGSGQGGGGKTQDAGGGQGGGQGEQKTFTQEELNRVVEDRLARERGKFRDYEDLKKKAKQYDDAETARLSETEKLQKRVTELETAKTDLENAAKARDLEINERLIRAEVRGVAATMQFISPEDAYSLADLAGVTVAEDGSIKGVQAALEKLAKAKPYLVGAGTGAGGTPNRNKTQGKADDKKTPKPVIHF